MADDGGDKLDQAFDELERETPDRMSRAIRWLRDPKSKLIRLPLGILALLIGIFGFMIPVLGIEMIPLGLLLLAQDIPFLRKPVGNLTLWLERQWQAARRWWRRKRG